jgi:hypothetical protein
MIKRGILFLSLLLVGSCAINIGAKPRPHRPPQPPIIVTNTVTITNYTYGFINLNNETNEAQVISFPVVFNTNGGKVSVEFYEFNNQENLIQSTNILLNLSTNRLPILWIDTAFSPIKKP